VEYRCVGRLDQVLSGDVAPGVATAAPTAKLTDFGITMVGDLDDDETVCSIRGSLPYLAPS
jgi:hypothetical protein